MKLKNVLKILLLKREITATDLAQALGSNQPTISRAIIRASIEPQKSVAAIMDALQCHAEIVIVDDVTGERYELD